MKLTKHTFLSSGASCAVIFLIVSFVQISAAVNDSRDLRLTLAEKNALEELKSQIWSRLTEPFMKSDWYLTRWIRRANLDTKMAKNLLLKTISWRKEQEIENILLENWSDLEPDYQLSFDGHDKQGRPILFISLGEWDLRAAVVHGNTQRLNRYLTYSTERQLQNIIKAQKNGKNVTRAVVIVDGDGINPVQHGCPICFALLVNWILDKENYYPNLTEETLVINSKPTAPVFGSIIFNTVRTVMTEDLKSQTKAFDANKKIWMKYLDQRIDKDQRTLRYGGTKIE